MINDFRLIRVYENSCEYNYENIFIVKNDNELVNKLLDIEEDLNNIDYEEREKKYGYESKIEIIESFIINNFETIDFYRTDIDCY